MVVQVKQEGLPWIGVVNCLGRRGDVIGRSVVQASRMNYLRLEVSIVLELKGMHLKGDGSGAIGLLLLQPGGAIYFPLQLYISL